MEQAEVDATNPLFEKIMAWLWRVTDQRKELEKQLPLYLSRPTGAVYCPDLHYDDQGNIWRYGRDQDGHCWNQLIRQDAKPLSPYRPTGNRLGVDPDQANAVEVASHHQLVFIKHASSCPQEDWCWEMRQEVTTPLSRLQVNLASHLKAIALGDLLLLNRDDITLWLGDHVSRDDLRPGQESLIILYRQFCPGLEVDDQEMQLICPDSVQEALNAVLNKLRVLQHRG